jgi:hypothetical protein
MERAGFNGGEIEQNSCWISDFGADPRRGLIGFNSRRLHFRFSILPVCCPSPWGWLADLDSRSPACRLHRVASNLGRPTPSGACAIAARVDTAVAHPAVSMRRFPVHIVG